MRRQFIDPRCSLAGLRVSEAVKKRVLYLDLFKTILVYGMVLAHVIQLIGNNIAPLRAANGISIVVNLITFSGFMLAFGIGIGSSKISAE